MRAGYRWALRYMGMLLDGVRLGGMVLATLGFALLGRKGSPGRSPRPKAIENAG